MSYLAVFVGATLLLTGPAMANWSYCYQGAVPAGVNQHPDYPPRPFAFERFVLPQTFKRLCGLPAEAETDEVRRLIADALQCKSTSDLAQKIDGLMTAPKAEILQAYFGRTTVPDGAGWEAVCASAQSASIATLSYGDGWYFDSDTPDEDWGRIVALTDALRDLSASLED